MLSAFSARAVKVSLMAASTSLVCLAQIPFFSSPDWAAKAVTVTGQVAVMKDNRPWAVSVGDPIQAQQRVISGADGHAIFQVSDGSTFEVFPNSDVVFRKNPGNIKDLIDLLVGRVRVHIEHLGNAPNNTRMMTPTAVISVRGTTFDVSVDDEDETTIVEVEEGSVWVQHALRPYGQDRILQDGESIKGY